MKDAALLYSWRVKAEAQPWFKGWPVTYEQHVDWLWPRISDPLVRMFVWSEDGKDLGQVRIDSNGELAFDGQGAAAVRMLERVQEQSHDRIKVTLDPEDSARAEVLEQAGFREAPVRFFIYRP